MNNAKWIVTATVLAAILMGSFSTAQAKEASSNEKIKSKHGDDPKALVAYQVRRYAVLYGLSEADQAKVENTLLAQQKDLADYEKVHGAKIKTVDEQIKKLQDEIATLEKSKGVHRNVRKELELDHQAELDKMITAEQKTKRVVTYLKGDGEGSYWSFLPKELKADLDKKYQDAAMALVASGEDKSNTAVKEVSRKLRASLAAVVTPEMRQTAETKYLQDSAMRSFAHYDLTDAQKAGIGELCVKNIKDRAETAKRYAQIRKDYETARQTMSKGSYSSHSAIREEIAAKILTEEQKKKHSSRYKSSLRRDKSSVKKGSGKAKTPK